MTIPERLHPAPLSQQHYDYITLKPLSGTIGAEVTGVDLNRLTPAQTQELRDAFARYLVLAIRDQQDLTPENHIAFVTLFGEMQPIVHLDHVPGHHGIQPIHRDAGDKRRITGELFHNDSTYLPTPPIAIAMRAVTLPPAGGDTAFANLQLAFDMLSPTMQDFLESLRVVHSAKRLFGSGADQSIVRMKAMDPNEGDREVTHPLVITHPVSGRKSIFVNPAYCLGIEGMHESESQAIFAFLFQHCAQIALTARVRWEPGTLVLWDNWAAHHSAIGDYEGHQRTLHRVSVGGFTP
ncbi:TauD/TfdA family dioxygenase [Aurantiacibacter sp. MUD11]|uniref:TauD/TfdA dioxygenase family protein n=1 Tax=Aurantiacibacter sp. MUD11 TaxID=3003265 RepID=UPI0022AB37DF|nr:TauD/TfdA family dioxygenase [Aurantiacibacter sp. MUD11]WAT16689.1 TauD/TfdA family dioxygenase [Aurantiacibacter sp. MUD11]